MLKEELASDQGSATLRRAMGAGYQVLDWAGGVMLLCVLLSCGGRSTETDDERRPRPYGASSELVKYPGPCERKDTIGDAAPRVVSFTYDDSGNVIQETDGSFEVARTWDAGGKLLSEHVSGLPGLRDYVDTYEYDEEGRWVRLKRQAEGNAEPSKTHERTFDASGNVIREEVQAVLGGEEHHSVVTHEYDGNRLVRTETDDDGDGEVEWRGEYVFEEDGGRVLYEEREADGTLRARTVSTYDASGHLVRVEGPGGAVSTYEYLDEGEILLEENDYDGDGEPEARTVYTYDESGNLLEESRLGVAEFGGDQVEKSTAYNYDCW